MRVSGGTGFRVSACAFTNEIVSAGQLGYMLEGRVHPQTSTLPFIGLE